RNSGSAVRFPMMVMRVSPAMSVLLLAAAVTAVPLVGVASVRAPGHGALLVGQVVWVGVTHSVLADALHQRAIPAPVERGVLQWVVGGVVDAAELTPAGACGVHAHHHVTNLHPEHG